MQASSWSAPLCNDYDVVRCRKAVSHMAQQLGFGTTAYTMLVTAASELARNTVVHGGGGSCIADVVRIADRTGIKLVFEDHGPGIADVSLAMTDGWSSRGSLGLGL